MDVSENTYLVVMHKMSTLSHKANDQYFNQPHSLQKSLSRFFLHISLIPFYTQPKLAASAILTKGFGEWRLAICE